MVLNESFESELFSRRSILFLGLVTVLSYFTFFHGYSNPPDLFWDENYHIASAQKYLNGVYFMELHPPLGKLLIAAGERLVDANLIDHNFIASDYARNLPQDFSFAGYRLFPVLFAWLTAPVLFLILLLITRSDNPSLLFSFLYIFDNALIVHSRGAMLEGTLLFFCALMLMLYLLHLRWKDKKKLFYTASLLFGVSFGLVITTKLVGLIMILLIPALVWQLWGRWRQLAACFGITAIGFFAAYVSVWQVHFALGDHVIDELPDNGYYQASEAYKSYLDSGANGTAKAFPVMLRDSLAYTEFYNKGVPKLDLCKEGENGSPFFYWPLGARAINYRWETSDGALYQYLYLVANPAVWFVALIGTFIGVIFFFAPIFLPSVRGGLQYRRHLTVFLGLYVSYMIAISQIDRVMYLYHYFLPLLFSFLITATVFMELKHVGSWKLTDARKDNLLLALAVCVFSSYVFYAPLSYYRPIGNEEVMKRAIVPLWELHCVGCKKESILTEKMCS